MNRYQRLTQLGLFLLLLSVTQGCYQMAPGSAADNSLDTPNELSRQKVNCQFVSVDTLGSVIKNQIGLPEGDVTLADNAAKWSLKEYATKLGKGDMAAGVLDDTSCGALKYKLATQVMIDACTEALNKDSTFVDRLFPNGTADYGKLYMTFLGRAPTTQESEALDRLNSAVSQQIFPAAACAAVAASLESLSRS